MKTTFLSAEEDSDNEQGDGEVAVGQLMTNIFGEESDEEEFAEGGQHTAEVTTLKVLFKVFVLCLYFISRIFFTVSG